MIDIALLPQHMHLGAGAMGRMAVTLRGPERASARYTLHVRGLESDWYALSEPSLAIGDGLAHAVLTLQPPAGAARGVHIFEVTATSDDGIDHATAEGTLVVATPTGPGTSVVPPIGATPPVSAPAHRLMARAAPAAIIAGLAALRGVRPRIKVLAAGGTAVAVLLATVLYSSAAHTADHTADGCHDRSCATATAERTPVTAATRTVQATKSPQPSATAGSARSRNAPTATLPRTRLAHRRNVDAALSGSPGHPARILRRVGEQRAHASTPRAGKHEAPASLTRGATNVPAPTMRRTRPAPTAAPTRRPTSTATAAPTVTVTRARPATPARAGIARRHTPARPHPTATPLPPTPTATSTPLPSPSPSATSSTTPIPPTSTPSPTRLRPTATRTAAPTHTPTATSRPTSTPTRSPSATRTPHPSATRTPRPTPTATRVRPTATRTPTRTPRPTSTPLPTRTPRPTRTPDPTATRTPQPTATSTHVRPTATLRPTRTPSPTPTRAATATPRATSTRTATAAPTRTPTPVAQPTIATSYAVTATRFVLRWTTQHAVSFAIDGKPLPLSGEASFALQTHTFVLVAAGPVRNQAVRNVYLAVADACAILVDGQRLPIPSTACTGSPTPRAATTSIPPSPTVALTSTPVATATPEATAAATPAQPSTRGQ